MYFGAGVNPATDLAVFQLTPKSPLTADKDIGSSSDMVAARVCPTFSYHFPSGSRISSPQELTPEIPSLARPINPEAFDSASWVNPDAAPWVWIFLPTA